MVPGMISKNNFTRRESLKLLGLAGVSSLIGGGVAQAQAAPATQTSTDLQGAGFYRFAVGDVKLTMVSDGGFPFSPPFPLFGANASEEAVKKTLADHFIDYDNVMGHVHVMVIDNGKDKILVDTGCGDLFGPSVGKMLPRLKLAGIEPKDITAVLLTHAHGDHFGGLLDAEGKSNFPNAEHLMSATEHQFWTAENPDLSKSGIPEAQRATFVAGAKKVLGTVKWTLLDGESDARSKVRVLPAPGHTPGHLTLLIDGGASKQLYYITDTCHHYAIMLPHPEYHVGFDTDRELSIQTRKRVFERAAADKLLVAGTHLPFPAVGHVSKSGDGYEYHPAVWTW